MEHIVYICLGFIAMLSLLAIGMAVFSLLNDDSDYMGGTGGEI